MTTRGREVESRPQFAHEGGLVSAEVFANPDPTITIHDDKLEPVSRQKRFRVHTRCRPESFEAWAKETILVDIGKNDLLIGTPERVANRIERRA